jgi:3-phosphoshikimate 1-carboxyvinyltransferase
VEEQPDALIIEGVPALRGAPCDSRGDHRLAMALAVAGMVARGGTALSGAEAASISYPGFWQHLAELGSG